MGWVTEERRTMAMTVFVSVAEVRRALGCSRSAAYDHLRHAAGRAPGVRAA